MQQDGVGFGQAAPIGPFQHRNSVIEVLAFEFRSARLAHKDVEVNSLERYLELAQQKTHLVYILFNPGGLTHTSVVLRDALLAGALPSIEIHLSNVHAREPFRQHSYFSDVAKGVISGFGALGYELALRAAMHAMASENQPEDP